VQEVKIQCYFFKNIVIGVDPYPHSFAVVMYTLFRVLGNEKYRKLRRDVLWCRLGREIVKKFGMGGN
jgi:hypothetical protein